MADNAFGLTADDVQVIKDLVTMARKTPGASLGAPAGRTLNRPAPRMPDQPTPEVYIALTPESGIPGLILYTTEPRPEDSGSGTITGTGSAVGQGNIPGTAFCEIYRIVFNADEDVGTQFGTQFGTGSVSIVPELEPVGMGQVLVYNLADTAYGGGEWLLVVRDKFGSWIAVCSCCGQPDIHGFHQHGTAAGECWYPSAGADYVASPGLVLYQGAAGSDVGSQIVVSGRAFITSASSSILCAVGDFAEGQLQAVPYYSGDGGFVNGIGFGLAYPGGLGTRIRIGLYDSRRTVAGDLRPHKLLVESDEIEADDWTYASALVNGSVKLELEEPIFLKPCSLYWFAMTFKRASPGPTLGGAVAVQMTGETTPGTGSGSGSGNPLSPGSWTYAITGVEGDKETVISNMVSVMTYEVFTGTYYPSGTHYPPHDHFHDYQWVQLNWGGTFASYRVYRAPGHLDPADTGYKNEFIRDNLQLIAAVSGESFLDKGYNQSYDGGREPVNSYFPEDTGEYTVQNHLFPPFAAPIVAAGANGLNIPYPVFGVGSDFNFCQYDPEGPGGGASSPNYQNKVTAAMPEDEYGELPKTFPSVMILGVPTEIQQSAGWTFVETVPNAMPLFLVKYK